MMGRRWISGGLLGLAAGAAVLMLSACQPEVVLKLVVNTTTDGHDAAAGDGVCEMTAGTGDCSLRAAFEEASAATIRSDVAVPKGLYDLLVPDPREAETSLPLTIGGAHTIGVHSDGAVVGAAFGTGVIQVTTGEVGIIGLSVTGASSGIEVMGPASVTLFATTVTQVHGPGIVVDDGARLTLSYVEVERAGPGITSRGDLTIDHGRIHDNYGTGVSLRAGEASVADSTISGNNTALTGGGIDAGGVTGTSDIDLTVRRSTIDHNTSGQQGGGIFFQRGTLVIEQSTIESNSGEDVYAGFDYGRGIKTSGTVTIAGSTLHDDDAGPTTGLLHLVAGSMTVRGTVLDDPGPACTGVVTSGGSNLDRSGACGLASTGDLSGVDPKLLPLGFNGGPTRTRLPGPGSPLLDAIPAGTVGLCDGSTPTDQRGAARPNGPACDIGSVEGTSVVPAVPVHLVVDTAVDGHDAEPGDGICAMASGGCSLRAAIDETNARPASDFIEIAPTVDPVLSIAGAGEDANVSGDLDITDTVDIDGNGRKVDAAGLDRAFDVVAGVRTRLHDLEVTGGSTTGAGGAIASRVAGGINPAVRLDGVIVHGNQAATGGGIDASGSVAIADSVISVNVATVAGGGVSGGGVLTIDGTRIADNTAPEGGGIFVPTAAETVRVTLSTVNGNRSTGGAGGGISVGVADPLVATNGSLVVDRSSIFGNAVSGGTGQQGGGIFQNGGDVTLLLSAVTGNAGGPAASSTGGGVSVLTGALTVTSSTISGNSAGSGGGIWAASPLPVTVDVVASTIVDNDSTVGSAIAGPASVAGSVLVGTGGVDACDRAVTDGRYSFAGDSSCGLSRTGDPRLGALADNDGPTASHLPAADSPLVDAIPIGTPGLCDDTVLQDQRTLTRLRGAGCDIGSVER